MAQFSIEMSQDHKATALYALTSKAGSTAVSSTFTSDIFACGTSRSSKAWLLCGGIVGPFDLFEKNANTWGLSRAAVDIFIL